MTFALLSQESNPSQPTLPKSIPRARHRNCLRNNCPVGLDIGRQTRAHREVCERFVLALGNISATLPQLLHNLRESSDSITSAGWRTVAQRAP